MSTSAAPRTDARTAGARAGARDDHTVPLAAGWRLWRLAVLRGAGFPAAMAAELASPDLRAAAQAVIGAEAADDLDADGAAALRQQREAAYAAAFGREQHRVFGVLRALAGQARFREAVAWQNPGALATGVDKLARTARAAPNSRDRARARLVARYLLRFCLKNDTVGFYGPMGWATFTDGADAREPRGGEHPRLAPREGLRDEPRDGLIVRPGPALVAKRFVSFERWCVAAVADAIAASLTQEAAGDAASTAWALDLAPRRLPHLRLERDRVVATDTGRAEPIAGDCARLLAACDGTRTASEIAAWFARSAAEHPASAAAEAASSGLTTERAVAAALANLAARGWIAWGLELPNFTPDPADRHEARLRGQIERIRGPRARDRAVAVLDRMCDRKDALERAVGDEAVTRAMGSLERAFTEITGRAASRRPGQVYAGRTLVYQDCARDVEVDLGPVIRTALAAPLALLFASARWYTHTIATRYRDAFTRIHAEMTSGGAAELALLPFADRAAALLPTGSEKTGLSPIVAEVAAELRARWADILGLARNAGRASGQAVGPRRLAVRAHDIADACAAAFDAPCPGWPSARYHSPDLLLAAPDPAAVAAGAFTLVIGELHAGINTVESLVVFSLRDDRATIARNLARDVTRPRIMRAVPGSQVDRAFILPLSNRDVEWTWETTPSWRERAIPASELVVVPDAHGLVVRTRDHRWRWDVVEFFDMMLAYDAAGRFGVASGPRLPRISIDDLVIQRETWTFDTAALPLRHDQDDRSLFLAAQRWARAHELPRHVFYGWYDGDDRQKPMPLDLASPIGVRLFVNATRRSPRVVVSEMLPGPDALWLTDREGAAYTSEIRVVALDPEPWRPPGESAAGESAAGAAAGDRARGADV